MPSFRCVDTFFIKNMRDCKDIIFKDINRKNDREKKKKVCPSSVAFSGAKEKTREGVYEGYQNVAL